MSKLRWDKYDVVSFDVFDTLVTRTVCRPKDVFKVVELRASSAGLNVNGFADARIAAERKARSAGKPEVTLADIYSSFDGASFDEALFAQLKAMEIQAELDLCVVNPKGRKLFDAALASAAKVVITSDMYLSVADIAAILNNCGYSGWDKMYVSSEYMATKSSGELFKTVFKDQGCRPSRFLHIGDNKKSDVIRPRMLGASSYGLKAGSMSASDLSESFLIGSKACAPDKPLERIGYLGLGPILVGFCEWLSAELKKDGIQRVFFLARDGLIVQKTMEILGYEIPESNYFYASRRSLQVPSFANISSLNEALGAIFLPRRISLQKLFSKLGLSSSKVNDVLEPAGINSVIEHNSSELANDKDAQMAFDLLQDAIHENAASELELLAEYLNQNVFSGKVAIVDIGWFGNMQLALEKVVAASDIDADVYGYYVGLSPYGKNQLSHKMKGYLFNAQEGLDLFKQERNYNMIFETLFSATHGTTRGYKQGENGIEPALAEYTGEEARVGHDAERCRQGALRFAKEWSKAFGKIIVPIKPELAMRELNRLGNSPSFEEANYFGGWGMEADGDIQYAAKPKNLGSYVTNPKRAMSDFSHTSWKVGFLKRLFKAPLPYDKFWNALHGAYEKKSSSADKVKAG